MKYIELVKGVFTAEYETRAYQADPYVAYSIEDGKLMLNLIPDPVIGPANNEIWYTTSDGNIVDPAVTGAFGANIVSNTYENGKGVITFDGDVTSIGDLAFDLCEVLTFVTIPNSVTSIGMYAFNGCRSLASITIPNSVTSIGMDAFSSCSSLTSITIPNSVTSIGESAFSGCRFTKENFVNNSTLDAEANNYWGVEFVDTEIDGLLIRNDTVIDCRKLVTSVSIPNSVTCIGDFAFLTCYSLTSVTICNSVMSIGAWAFSSCGSLTSITYEGTQDQWNAITKGGNWNNQVPATYVQCSDGQVAL